MAHDNGNDAAFHGYFSQRTKVPTGLVEVRFHNDGSQDHMAQFFKLNGDVSESTVKTRLAAVFSASTPSATVAALHALLDVASAAGGADSITPGASQDVIERFTAGHYVVVCFDTTSNGTPHFLLGMFKGFWAVPGAWAPEDPGQPTAHGNPVSNGTVIEFDHKIVVPHQISSHEPITLKIRVYDQTHEFQLLKVPEHTTASQLLQCFTGPQSSCALNAPPIDAGGAAAIAPGSTHWVELHLAPGTYAALCFVPDINTGMPHAFMGMITVFTVRK
ncbi:MAG TPA: hypothetical protein VFN78_06000 [Ktedonobacterales bacterium]|nr:hypothetical protein [Ktedonobacterales bacterium]